MTKLVGILAAIVLSAPMAQALAADVSLTPAQPSAEEVLVFAGGGTQLTSGYFFPGTRVADGNGTTGAPPLAVPQGANLRFVNVDHYIVAGGAHKITSFDTVKVKRKGKKIKVPLFSSKTVDGPGETIVKTSHLKPGEYLYYCPIHNGMLGAIEVQ